MECDPIQGLLGAWSLDGAGRYAPEAPSYGLRRLRRQFTLH